MSGENGKQLPTGWGEIQLNQCAAVITKGTTPTTHGYEYLNEGIRFVRVEHFSNGVIDTSAINEYISPHAHDFLKRSRLCENDVLVSIAGTIGRVAIVRSFDTPANTNQAVGIIRGVDRIFHPPFLRSMLASPCVQESIRNRKRGGGMNNISLEDLRGLSVPLPPFPEQLRIAEALDELLSDLDAAFGTLERVRSKLNLYRASVLKAVVEGAFTAEWREQHPHTEPASELLKRLLSERRRRWEEEQLRKFKEKGKEPPRDWKGKYKEPVAADPSSLPKLPDGWCWATIEDLTSELMNGYGKRSQAKGSPRIVLRLADITNGQVSYDHVRRINSTDDETHRYRLAPNDLLILRVNGSPDLVGRLVLVRETNEETLFCDHFIRARCVAPSTASWIRTYADTQRFRRYIDLNKVSSAGQNTISQSALSPFAIPLPPSAEQDVIVEAVEAQLSIIDHLEADLDARLKSAQRLRQSILGHAFAGQLVPQDPNDEPASVLLNRIAADREARAREAATAKQATAKPKASRNKRPEEISKKKRSAA